MTLLLLGLLTAMLTIATPLLWAALGELITEKSGVINLGIEGIMYAGAFVGFIVSGLTGSPWLGLLGAIAAGLLAGALMGLLTVTLGVNQHVAGLGLTLLLVATCDFTNRLVKAGTEFSTVPKFDKIFPDSGVFAQYGLTYVVLLLAVPLLWWSLNRTGFGLRIHATGENPEAADVAGIPVHGTRYLALLIGSALMAIGGAFITLALLGSFTVDIISGRGWVVIAIVIFARWRVWPAVGGALLFAFADALRLQLAIVPPFSEIPNEILIALPYLIVIAALAIRGRGIRYPGAYLRPYRRA